MEPPASTCAADRLLGDNNTWKKKPRIVGYGIWRETGFRHWAGPLVPIERPSRAMNQAFTRYSSAFGAWCVADSWKHLTTVKFHRSDVHNEAVQEEDNNGKRNADRDFYVYMKLHNNKRKQRDRDSLPAMNTFRPLTTDLREQSRPAY